MSALLKELVIAALAAAADVMNNVDPDDRSDEQNRLVELTLNTIRAAALGDETWQALITEAVPSWRG